MDFKEVYKGPFNTDKYCPVYIWSSNGVMTLMIEDDDFDNEFMYELVDKMNGQGWHTYTIGIDGEDPSRIYINNKSFLIRGWGHLTGTLNFSNEKAVKIQDDFRDWLVEALTN